jgi:DNA-binding response OmpR family regulator
MKPSIQRAPPRVLLVEDERHIVESLSFVLEREGFEVAAAGDGESAIEALRARRPDVLVLDVMLPRLGGLEVLKLVRAEATLRTLPVVVLTARGRPHDRRMAEEIGVEAFMTKPFANQDVVEAVRRLAAVGA